MLKSIFLVGLGGATGSVLRFLINFYMAKSFSSGFPWATFTVNIIGSLLIGLFIGLFGKLPEHENLKLLLATGFCGGFTTFSTFSLEHLSLLQNGHTSTAILYMALSLFLGIAAVFMGLWLAR